MIQSMFCSDEHCSHHIAQTIIHNQQIIYDLLTHIDRKVSKEMSDLAALTTEVQNNTSVDESAITLLNGLSAQLALIANDPAAVQALADQLRTSSTDLAAAVAANTPVVVPPVEPPPVDAPPVDVPPVDVPPVEVPPTI